MWETPEALWRRLKLGREEYLQRLLTTLIVGGDPSTWNTPRSPSEHGRRFLRLLDDLAHDNATREAAASSETFVDEYPVVRGASASADERGLRRSQLDHGQQGVDQDGGAAGRAAELAEIARLAVDRHEQAVVSAVVAGADDTKRHE